MEVKWHKQAIADRRAATLYLRSQNPEAARNLLYRLIESSRSLAHFPESGRPGIVAKTRELVPVPTYIMVYEVDEKDQRVTILRLWHTSQNRP